MLGRAASRDINLTKIISSSYANVNEVVELCLVCQRHG